MLSKLTGGKKADAPPAKAAIRASLQNFRRQNFAIDENNVDHINAYLTLRSSNSRCGGAQLESYIKSLKQTVQSGEENKATFWAVPRGNFPNGLPENIQKAVCKDDVTTGCSFSASEYHYIDMVIPREALGMNVGTSSKILNKLSEGIAEAATGDDAIEEELGGSRASALGMLAIQAVPAVVPAPSSGAGVAPATSEPSATGVRPPET